MYTSLSEEKNQGYPSQVTSTLSDTYDYFPWLGGSQTHSLPVFSF